jgi:hypothetical protein
MLEYLDCVNNGWWSKLRISTIPVEGNWTFTYNGQTLSVTSVNNPTAAAQLIQVFLSQFSDVVEIYNFGEGLEMTFLRRPTFSWTNLLLDPGPSAYPCRSIDMTDCPPHCECTRICFSPLCPTGLVVYGLPPDTKFVVYIRGPHVTDHFIVTTDSTGTLWKPNTRRWNFFQDYYVYLRDETTGMFYPQCFKIVSDSTKTGPLTINL